MAGFDDQLDQLRGLIDAASCVAHLPEGNLRQLPEARELWDHIDARIAARQFEYLPESSEPYALVEEASKQAPEPGSTLLTWCLLRRRDRAFLENNFEALRIFRGDWHGLDAEFPEQEIALGRAGDSFIPLPTGEAERVRLAMLVELDLFVPMVDGEKASEEAKQREPDTFELWGELHAEVVAGVIRRVAIGSGCCVLTDRRLIGMIFDDEIAKRPKTSETWAMPISAATGETSTAILFSVDRANFERAEDLQGGGGIMGRYLQNRVPATTMIGSEVKLKLQPYRVIRGGQVFKPAKGEITREIKSFCEPRAD